MRRSLIDLESCQGWSRKIDIEVGILVGGKTGGGEEKKDREMIKPCLGAGPSG